MIEAFNRDTKLQDKFIELVQEHGILSVIETGTFEGKTTAFFAEHVEKVVTIESSGDYFKKCDHLDELKNVTRLLGSSADRMADAIRCTQAPRLYFLDAHWGGGNPLLAELEAISLSGEEPVIIVHDFQVPGCPSLGYDMFDKDTPICLELVTPVLRKIYGSNAAISFNDDSAGGSRRGVLIVEPLAQTAKA